MDCQQFYQERDKRTNAYLSEDGRNDLPIIIEIGPEASEIPAGQLTLLALANQSARVHRQIYFSVEKPEVELRLSVPFAEDTLGETLWETCNGIDPCGDFRISDHIPPDNTVSLGIGRGLSQDHDWYVGVHRAVARLHNAPLPVRGDGSAILRGAALASCLGAAALFRASFELPVSERRLSAWNFESGAKAAEGPRELSPVDVGRVLMVGAGAVGGALTYWLYVFGVSGEWTVLDPDHLELHNTNRHLLSRCKDVGWNGEISTQGLSKSKLVERYLPGSSEQAWYGEAVAPKRLHDVVLCVANEHDVRTKVAQRNDPVVLHATTGQSWLSQLHRHVAGQDDCIRCRTHDIRQAHQKCSKGEVQDNEGDESQDAALPFLSAASGLMLASSLQRLQAGVLTEGSYNNWDWDFASTRRMSRKRIRRCRDECSVWCPPEVRSRMNNSLKWQHLDQGI